MPPADANKTQATQESSSIRVLAKSIDPSNMSRNDARAIATALGQTGELKLDKGLDFLEKFESLRENPEVNFYA